MNKLRKIIPDSMPILLAGFGKQGGNIKHLSQLVNRQGTGVFINSSRSLLYPYNPDESDWKKKIENAVIEMKDQLNFQKISI